MTASPSLHSFRVPRSQQGIRLVAFIADRLQISGSKAKATLDQRSVWVNGRRIWMAKHPLSADDVVEVRLQPPPAAAPEQTPSLLYEDQHILAVNKPSGQISDRDAASVESRLRRHCNAPGLRALHRLDKETSGVLLFLKSPEHRPAFIELFRGQRIEKEYGVLLAGRLPSSPAEVTKRLEGKEARSVFVAQAASPGFCRATCQIQTGRTHQIRKHAQVLGCRVLGDAQYSSGPEISLREKKLPRLMLHAERLSFPSPLSRMMIDIRAPWPPDFHAAAQEFQLLS